MRTVITYHKGGTKSETVKKTYQESYDSSIDKPFHQRVLDSYYAMECQGKVTDQNVVHSKKFTAEVHKRALAEGW